MRKIYSFNKIALIRKDEKKTVFISQQIKAKMIIIITSPYVKISNQFIFLHVGLNFIFGKVYVYAYQNKSKGKEEIVS